MTRALLITLALSLTMWAANADDTWKSPFTNRTKLESPLVEVTPFVFNEKLYLMESWQKQWEYSFAKHQELFQEDEVRIRDVAADRIVSVPLVGHGLAMTFVWEGRAYVFGSDWGNEKKWQVREVSLTSSDDLENWTEPNVVLRSNDDEKFFNVSVCRGDGKFVMLVETNDPRWPAFTFKYFVSDDLENWEQVPDAYYGVDKYVGGPALYYEGGYYYTLYLQSLGERRYETRVTRSKDLITWEDAPVSRPFVTYQPESKVHPLRPHHIRERNASDAEICYFRGKTLVYYTGGDQQFSGDLQRAEFAGTPQELLEHFFTPEGAVVPSARQLRYQENQLGAFVHYGPAANTENSDMFATPPADAFNPTALDTDQWAETAKAFGAKHIVLTAKHHNGYCLWPTETTDYSIKQSPWKDGKGDVVREFVDSARKFGISPGLYVSAADKKFGVTSTPDPMGERKLVGDLEAYFPIFLEQLREVLTNYGPLEVIWLDAAFDPTGPDVMDGSGTPIGTRYGDAVVDMVRTLQPGAVIMGGSRADIRWAGSEQGLAPYPLWNVVPAGEGLAHWIPDYSEGWFLPEANIHTRSTWFWQPDSDGTLKTDEQMRTMYGKSIGHGANLLVNMTPDRTGRIPAAEEKMLLTFGEAVAAHYGKPMLEVNAPKPLKEGGEILLDLGSPTTVAEILLEEDLHFGQRVAAYRVDAQVDGVWKTVATGESIGRKRIQSFEPVAATALKVVIVRTEPEAHLRRIAVYSSAF